MFNQIQAIRQAEHAAFMYAAEADTGLRRGELARLSGPAIFLDRISGNGRQYIPESVHAQVAELQPRIAKKALFGVLDHPMTQDLNELAYVKMTEVSHRIDAMWYNEKEKTYYITITILDTPNGRILKSIIDAGSPIYVSLRSLLDPSRNQQMNGYVRAWVLSLITIDIVSRPGFADAEMQPIDVQANEAALAVCESLNLFGTNFSQRNFDMKTTKYIPLVALESLAGVATQPTKEFEGAVTAFIADVLDKHPGKFTADEFGTSYPDGMFNDMIVGLYEDTNELMLQDNATKTMAMISLKSETDGQYQLNDDADIEYYNTEIADNSNEVNTGEEATEGLYAIVATEGFEPAEGFITIANKVAAVLKDKYPDGFDQALFNTEIAAMLDDEYNVSARIEDSDDDLEIRIVDDNAENGASIKLSKCDDKYCIEQVSEYWQPGTESEVGDKVVIKDASGDTIVTGEIQALGTFGEHKDTIKSEDEQGYQNCLDANISDDIMVYKIGGDWYFIEEGMSIEPIEAEGATEAEIVEDIDKGMNIKVIEGEETLEEGICQECGTLGEYRDLIAEEDEDAAKWLECNECDDSTPVAKVNDKWYIGAGECNFMPAQEPGTESIDATQQTDGNQNDPLKVDQNYMKTGDDTTTELEQAEIVDENDETGDAAQQALANQTFEIVEGNMAEIVDDEPEPKDTSDKKPKVDDDATQQDQDDANANELATEAQRIFAMPNSRFAGIYAIEHMPAMYKHIWNGLTDDAKTVLAKQAQNAQIATEAQNLKFWAGANFIAIERACLTTKGKVEAALESLQIEDPKAKFLKGLTAGYKF